MTIRDLLTGRIYYISVHTCTGVSKNDNTTVTLWENEAVLNTSESIISFRIVIHRVSRAFG